jgi:hypothetical protein
MKRIGMLGVWILVAMGCESSEPCDKGSHYVGSGCVVDTPTVDAAATGMADATAMAKTDSATTVDFASACTDGVAHSDCQVAAKGINYCARQPGAPTGYCTATGCDTMPTLCPPGWTCFNLGMFQPGLPYMCMKPAGQ